MGANFGNTIGLGRDTRDCFVYDKRRWCQTVLQTQQLVFAVDAETCGSNKVINGTFDNPGTTASWSSSSAGGILAGWGWSAPGYVYHQVGLTINMFQNNILTAGKRYKITFTVGRHVNPLVPVNGSLTVFLGTNNIATVTASGTYTFYGEAQDHYIRFAPNAAFDGYLDDITIFEVQTQVVAFLVDENDNHVFTPNTLTPVGGQFYFNLPWSSFEADDGCYTLCIYNECGVRFDNIVDNGAFNSGFAFWTPGVNWSIVSGRAHHDPLGTDTLVQDLSPWLLAGKKYTVVFTTTNFVSGSFQVNLGGTTHASTFGSNGVNQITITTPGTLTHNELRFIPTANYDGDIDDVQVILHQDAYEEDICSACLSLETDVPECAVKLSWTNDDAAFGLDYGNSTFLPALQPSMYLQAYLRIPRYDEEETEFRRSSGSLEKLYFRTEKTKELFIEAVPEYICDSLSVGKGHDHFYIDGVEYVVQGGFEPEFNDQPENILALIKMRVRKKVILQENKNC